MNFFILGIVLVICLYLGLIVSNLIVLVLLMEVTLFTFLFIVYDYNVLNYGGVCVKYFLVQSIASLLLLLSCLFFIELDKGIPLWSTFIALTGVFVNLGAFPIHFWVIPVFNELPFFILGVLGIPMKILPLSYLDSILLFYHTPPHVFIFLLVAGVASILTGIVLGLAATNLRAILGASSITHTGWFFFAFYTGYIVEYFLLYSFTLILLLCSLIYISTSITSLSLFGLSGLPPFSVFFANVLILNYLCANGQLLIFVVVAMFTSILSLFYYLNFSLYFFLRRQDLSRLSLPLLFSFLTVNLGSAFILFLFFFYGRVWR